MGGVGLRLSVVIAGLLLALAITSLLAWWLDRRAKRRATAQERLDAYRVIAKEEAPSAKARRLGVDELEIENMTLWSGRVR